MAGELPRLSGICRSFHNSTDKAGIVTATPKNFGVGLDPYNDKDNKIARAAKEEIQEPAELLIMRKVPGPAPGSNSGPTVT